jgi:Rad3-related DNA helicase
LKTLEDKSLSSHFPSNSTPRLQQVEALEKIQKCFASNKKYVIACLPTGSGKSHIGVTVGNSTRDMSYKLKSLINDYSVYKKNKNGDYIHESDFLNADPSSSYILTITKSLQDQYQNLFNDIPTIKGKNNYQCDVDSAYSAENAPCLFSKKLKQNCFDCDRCPYYKARNNALSSKTPILNYRVFFNLPSFLRKREIYICDEASGLEDELVSKYTFELKYSQIDNENIKYKKILTDDSKSVLFWLQDVYVQLENRVESIKTTLNDMDSGDKAYFKEMQKLSKLNRIFNSLQETLEYWDSSSYLVEKRDSDSLVLCPYDIKPIAKNIFSGADKVLMMSATLSNHKEFAKSLGIDDYEYFESESTFDPKKSPIFCSKKFKLSYNTMEQNLPHVLDAAVSLCDKHSNEKGVIHTHTNFIANKLQFKTRNNSRFLFKDISSTNEEMLNVHKNTNEPTVLVSPSLDTGISLDDDLGRFQIILKSPYLPLSSKRIKKMMDANPKHYTMKMLNKLIQMCGRCTRSSGDYSITYILDAVIVDAIMREKQNLPKHFLDRLV